MTALEDCNKPVIAAVHGACVGGGVDLITSADIRLCSQDATFCVKEADLAITADLGTLQRLPAIIGEGRARELALTARAICAADAEHWGMVTAVHEDSMRLTTAALSLAQELAQKPRAALVGTKHVMLHGRGWPVADNLDHVAMWNAGMLLSDDLVRIVNQVRARAKL
jgi:Delta3,5-Delta2,4-dienoyl-CoA isomerase